MINEYLKAIDSVIENGKFNERSGTVRKNLFLHKFLREYCIAWQLL